MTRARVLISGMGVVAPNGMGVEEFRRNTQKGISGISRIETFDTTEHRVKIGGSVGPLEKDRHLPTVAEALYDRVSVLAKIAADEALESAAVEFNTLRPERVGIIVGQGLSGMQSVENWHRDYFVDKTGITVDDFIASFPNATAALLAMEYGIKGLNYTTNTACSSSAAAVGLAALLIRSGVLDVCLAGGADAPLTPATLKCFERLKILNTKDNEHPQRACRPFSANRKGMVVSEGAGMMVLESDRHLGQRDGRALCEIAGYGWSNDAWKMLAPSKDGQVPALRRAIEDAGIRPMEVDYIHAHGTGTRLNDYVETEAIKEVYGRRAFEIPISSVKSMVGHTIGASAVISMICTIGAIHDAFLPPTINLEVEDPALGLDYVALDGRAMEIETAVVNAFGFGGSNNVVVLRKVG